MDMDLKKTLPEKLEAIAPEYGLIELAYPSFTRTYGFQLSSLSAADAVEGLSSLLEAAVGVRLEVEREGGRNGTMVVGLLQSVMERLQRTRRTSIPEAIRMKLQRKRRKRKRIGMLKTFGSHMMPVTSKSCSYTLMVADKQYHITSQITPISSNTTSGNHSAGLGVTGQSYYPAITHIPISSHEGRS
jgi:hypothetical protein